MYLVKQKGIETDPVLEIINPGKIGIQMREIRLAGEFANILAEVYPGYFWLVNVNFEGMIATIECGQINTEVQSNMTYKYILHLKDFFDAGVTRRKLIISAGEMLERAFMRRGSWTGEYPTLVHGVADHHQPNAKIIQLYQAVA